MSYSRFSILIVEDDSRISRLVRDHILQHFPDIRAEIAGSPARALGICQKFPPTVIVWDGLPNERGTAADYAACIPEGLWPRLIPISQDTAVLETAAKRGALEPYPKVENGANTWAEGLVGRLKTLLPARKKK